MIVGVLTTDVNVLKSTNFLFDHVNIFVILADNAAQATVVIVGDLWLESKPRVKDGIYINLVTHSNASNFKIINDNKIKRNWVSAKIRNEADSIVTIEIPPGEFTAHQEVSLGIKYDVAIVSRELDLSVHASPAISTILFHMTPQQEVVPIEQANLWLIYNNSGMQVHPEKSASENRLSGSDILKTTPLTQFANIKAKGTYTRLLWDISRPSLNVPFYLRAVIQASGQDTSVWNELKAIVANMGERIHKLEGSVATINQEVDDLLRRVNKM